MEIHKHLQLIWWSHYFYDDVLIKKNVSAALLMNSGAWEKWNTNKYQTYIKNTTLKIIFPNTWTKQWLSKWLKRILKSLQSRYRKKNKNKKTAWKITTKRVSKINSEKRTMLTNRSNFNFNSILTSTEETVETDFHVIILTYFVYGTIFLVSLVGNSFLIHIIRTVPSMKTAINYLILNQACAGLLIPFMHLMDNLRNSSYHGLWLEETWVTLLASYILQAFMSPHLFLFFYSLQLLSIASTQYFDLWIGRPFLET